MSEPKTLQVFRYVDELDAFLPAPEYTEVARTLGLGPHDPFIVDPSRGALTGGSGPPPPRGACRIESRLPPAVARRRSGRGSRSFEACRRESPGSGS